MDPNIENAGVITREARATKSAAQKARENVEKMLRDLIDQELANGRSGSDLYRAIVNTCPQALLLDHYPFESYGERAALKVMAERERELNPPTAGNKTGPKAGQPRVRPEGADEKFGKGLELAVNKAGKAFFDYFVADFDCYIGDMTREKLASWGKKNRERSFIAEALIAQLPNDASAVVSKHLTAKAVGRILKEAQDQR